ncbi:MAG: DUF58 domain-containing protein [uncultured Thiotrichaceae bacterium]|uniref:DUF58 domain-containing protein n=1 Tax=uncultured Thiotrichaceae bacterium TaxID=298394 RepID=A0A6S6TPD1_9GAMM|nr:MAG: DUF58 domain-containing protein [uncultured Thiotrichaceae bacterium]
MTEVKSAAANLSGLWASWVERRLPKSRQIRLGQRQIFIVPNKLAAAMLGLILLLFVLAANFQNSLIYIVCFWLVAMLTLNILHTYHNLSGLSVRAIRAEPCFSGEHATVELELSRTERQRKYAITVGWPEQDTVRVDLIDNQTMRIKITHPTIKRGYFRIPRLTISTTYPTGLAIAWSYFTPDIQAIIYPTPKANPLPPQETHAGSDNEQGMEIPRGSNDFGGIREYQHGDTPKQIHWGKYAQTGELYTKAFVDYQTDDCWLDWDTLTFPGIEARLSHLCSRLLELHEQRQTYGLKLPGTRIEPDHGEAHKTRCLHALAIYGVTP